MESPLHHFELHPIIPLTLLGFDISINKAILAMWAGMAVLFILFRLAIHGGMKLVPGRLQNFAEITLEFLLSMVTEYIGKEGKKYFPFIATLFLFLFSCNLIGLVPGSYTLTSQLVVTGTFAVFIFFMTLVIGFARHGLHFLGILVPPGIPKILIPLMIPIEIISMLARPLTLAVRLFANMTAGHTLMGVLFGMALVAPLYIGWLPFGFTVVVNGLEIFIAFIQAYIFSLLTCVYISDALKLH
ncbi:MAG: F0F1 ATP synthase subunit A [Nitrospinales bacterium]